ncbi:MAG: hypothetical protein PHD48_00720 [Alphaproteobacteria bacterium]|nr:hypothetical protein [Alphaproteobacteria bacterium]
MSHPQNVDQRNATAGRDIIAGDMHYHLPPSPTATVIEQLLVKLQQEIEDSAQVRAMIDRLRYYYEQKATDGITGLEAKLKKGGREHEVLLALEKKEMFVKMLDKWSLYSSAQEIFVYLLAKAEHEFSYHVLPQIGNLRESEINEMVSQKIVEPIVAECGATTLKMHHGMAMGMVYWLAEQCFVRWHK